MYTVASMLGPKTTSSVGRIHYFAYALLCLLWGSSWLAIRITVRDIPPFKAAGLRFLIAAVVLFGSLLFRKAKWPVGERQWNAILILSFTVMTLPYGLLFWAEQYVSSSMTAILFSSMPLATALLTPVMTSRTVPRQTVFAMVIAFGGLLLLYYTTPNMTRSAVIGGIAVLVAMFSSAWSLIFAKERIGGIDPVMATALQFAFGSIGLFWATWALESHRQTTWSLPSVLALAYLGIFGSAAGFATYYWLLRHLEPYQLASSSLIIPVVAVFEGWLFSFDRLSATMVLATLVVLGAVATVLRAEEEPKGGTILGIESGGE
ncbi:MAG TPA: EamA family transporter [Candidatus Angelobacter sp.]|nr:EamA family transporter [Candidatus Angelobacter sp.]